MQVKTQRHFTFQVIKKGQGMDPSYREFIGDNALSIDLINIAPLDDLHHPHGFIHEAQQLAAHAFGADYTFFFCSRHKRCDYDDDYERMQTRRQNYCSP